MIKLYQFQPCWNLLNASPFCMKLETYLRMVNLPYEVVTIADPGKSPKGKIPFIKDDERVIADSGIIIDYLKEKYGDPLDEHLTPLQKAQALAWRRLMEEHLYWASLYSRWVDETNWPQVKEVFFGKIPSLKREIFAYFARKHMLNELYGHGIGRHTKNEIYQMAIDDLTALLIQLGDQNYFMGDKPTSIDACFYAYIANLLKAPIHCPMTEFVKTHETFINYCHRMDVLINVTE